MRSGVVLCGGRSSRMGRAKAWLPWGGRPVLAHVVERLAGAVDEVIVVASESLELPRLPARIARDREPELGPLGGIREGLAHAAGERVFVTATDAPFLTPAFVDALFAVDGAVAPEQDGVVQSLSAVYPRSALPCATALLQAGRRRPLSLLEAQGYRRLPAESLPDASALRGFNTPDEYLAAVRESGDARPVTLELLGRARLAAGRREIETTPGTLAEVLAAAPASLGLVEGERLARAFLVSLDGRGFLRDLSVPVGPGEHVLVLDASVGG